MEFTISYDLEGKTVIGMNKGSQAEGTIMVESAETCEVLTDEGLLVARVLTDYINER